MPVGTTGESATLSHDEHRRVVELCVKTAAGRVPVIAGAGSNSTAEAIELVRHAKAVGADAALVVTPYYNRPSQEGLYAHYAAIDEAVQLPVLVYNVPGRTSVDIANETLVRLAKLPNIVGDQGRHRRPGAAPACSALTCGEDWVMLSGDDPHRAGLHRPRRPRLHLGDRQRRAASMARPDTTPAWPATGPSALDWPGPADPPAQGAVPRRLAVADQVRPGAPGPLRRGVRLPIAACAEAARAEVLDAMRDAGVI